MAIEGPLRELGIHDVFQLLDLSRKTGALRVTSGLRDNDGTVWFERGRVVHAAIRSNPHPIGAILQKSGKITEADLARARDMQAARPPGTKLGQILVEMGAITTRELERQVRLQIEAVIFELMSWREGFFSFEEGAGDPGAEIVVKISTDALVMEGARRIDEWSRIADKVPSLLAVPVLAPLTEGHSSSLDLQPSEWEVLAMIDGATDLKSIAAALGKSEFDVGKVTFGLVTTGVVELRLPERMSGPHKAFADAAPLIDQARVALDEGRIEAAIDAGYQAVTADPSSGPAHLVYARALGRVGRPGEAMEELRRALQLDPLNPDVHLELGYASIRRGHLGEAVASWQQYLNLLPGGGEAERIRAGVEAANRLDNLLESHHGR